MTEAENLISKGLRAERYTKGETKKGKRSTQEESTVIAKRESEHDAILRPFRGQKPSLLPQRGKQSVKISIAFHPLKSNPQKSHIHLRRCVILMISPFNWPLFIID